MRYGSVCSGIEAASVAWHSLGWSAAWFAEIEAFPSAVLAHRFPNVMNVGDMLNLPHLIRGRFVEVPDVIVGGTPCQAFSVAGARQSLDDDRGQLTLAFIEIINAIDEIRTEDGKEPVIVVWENVPGVLSTPDNAFGCFLGELCGSGEALQPAGKRWGNASYIIGPKRQAAYRILDAQFFGVAQRRRRVFVVASARTGFDPSSVLFEFDGVRRDTPPSRDPGQNTTPCIGGGFASSSFAQYRPVTNDGATIKASGGDLGGGSENLVIHGTQDPITSDVAFPLGRNQGQENAVFGIQGSMIGRSDSAGPQGSGVSEDVSFTLTRGDRHGVAQCYNPDQPQVWRVYSDTGISPAMQSGEGRGNAVLNHGLVRRLTPIECERLQGFPDDWTKIPYRKKLADDCPDGPRYAAIGNSMAVPVMHWIGKRIDRAVTMEYDALRGINL
ncbi:MAG: DNA cytosine methyltransferase [Alistipes sp.]